MLPQFEIAGELFYTYPLMIGIAWAMGYLLLTNTKNLFTRAQLRVFYLGLFVASWLGAKIVFLISTSDQNLPHLAFWTGGGFVFYGGLFFGAAHTVLFFKVYKIPFSRLNKLTPILAFVHGVGRIGCFLSGCCYGEYMVDGLRHPTQLYESTFLILLAIYLQRRLSLEKGTVVPYIFSYSLLRFFNEFLRADEVRGFLWNGISTSQALSVFILGAGLIIVKVGKAKIRT